MTEPTLPEAIRMLELWLDQCKPAARDFLERSYATGPRSTGAIVVFVDGAGAMSYALLTETDDEGNDPPEEQIERMAQGILSHALGSMMFNAPEGGFTIEVEPGHDDEERRS